MSRRTWTAGLVLGTSLLGAVAAQSAEPPTTDTAIRNGVKFIKSTAQDGSWGDLGPTALNALTLLECSVPADDPVLVKAAENIRKGCLTETRTYVISLCILCLDRLHDPRDVPLIESLAVRLLGGQDTSGGWSYTCPAPSADEVHRLETAVQERGAALTTRPDARPGARRTVKDLPEPIRAQLARLNSTRPKPKKKSDNSNTQFAIFGIWVAHRHGIPIDDAMGLVEQRIRRSQLADGGWTYTCDDQPPGTPFGEKPKVVGEAGSYATMTCAGLCGLITPLGLLAEKGAFKKLREAKSDPALQVALLNLASAIGEPITKKTKTVANVGGKSYYFLWSMERVCVGLNLSKLAGMDWYAWGSKFLLLNQQADGSWRGDYAANNADTCFALLFLKRANLIRDLTARIGNDFKHFEERKLEARVGALAKKLQPSEPAATPAVPPARPKKLSGDRPPSDSPSRDPHSDDPPLKTNAPGDDVPAAKLAEELVNASGEAQAAALARLRDGKGVRYTEALITAIDRLTGTRKDEARKALVARLARMKPDTLVRYLTDDEAEVRRAAAVAIASRGLTDRIPDLIARLHDRSVAVGLAAHAALVELSGQDIRLDAAAWEAWWDTQKKD